MLLGGLARQEGRTAEALTAFQRAYEGFPRHPDHGASAVDYARLLEQSGRFEEAAFVRELFDEPAALLYQVGALLDGLADIGGGESAIAPETLIQQIDGHIRDISSAAEGPLETELEFIIGSCLSNSPKIERSSRED